MSNKPVSLLFLCLLLLSGCQRTKTEFWSNGNKKSESNHRGSVAEGVSRFWYEDGTLQMECNYKENKLEGPFVRYYSNGIREESRIFKNGMQNGEYKAWDRSGHLIKQGSYKDDKPDGAFWEWYPDGAVRVEGQYKNGVIDGRWIYFSGHGVVIGEGTFTNGTGIQKAFYENGRLKQTTPYQDNQKNGEEIFYRNDGTIERINRYDMGQLLND
jgi:antitoxin component YwqK of YwqJK toxin-antitoxin module